MALLIYRTALVLLPFLLTELALAGAPPETAVRPPSEYEIKAAFMFNFAKFVEWPTQTGNVAGRSIVVCVLGKDPFGATLDQVIQGKSVNGRLLESRRIERLEEVRPCQVLFISASERSHLAVILASLKEANVLTISESDRFLQYGGIIKLLKDENRIRFEINVDAASHAGLKISSKLLHLAKAVYNGSHRVREVN